MTLLKHVIEAVLAKHTAAAVTELTAILQDEIDERVVNRVADLREQVERPQKD
ncbi:MAG TPA: hypothetical protein VFP82_06035 [Chthoniobacterales bacterium]|nr:hypothetical protein [Chthoniobacterales bacterium]